MQINLRYLRDLKEPKRLAYQANGNLYNFVHLNITSSFSNKNISACSHDSFHLESMVYGIEGLKLV